VKKLPALALLIFCAACITILDLYALSRGVNGTLFSASIATIAALAASFAGFKVGRK